MMTMPMLIVALVMWVLLVLDGGNGGGSNGERSGIADDDGPKQMNTAHVLNICAEHLDRTTDNILVGKPTKATSA